MGQKSNTMEICGGLLEKLTEIDIKLGDTVYVASDIRTFLYSTVSQFGAEYIDEGLDELTNILQESVGVKGTILFPVFSWDFCKGKGFDYYRTQGEVGTYSNWILNNRDDFKRTRHPMYSFMVWGKDTELYCNMDNQDAWGKASPFYHLMKNGGKQLDFNAESYRGLTFIHCIEQWVGVPYRHPKYFYGKYIDEHGRCETRCYSMYVRDIEVNEHTKTIHKYLIDNQAAVETIWNNNTLTVVDIEKCYEVVSEDIIHHDGKNNLKFENYIFKFKSKQTIPYEVSKIPLM